MSDNIFAKTPWAAGNERVENTKLKNYTIQEDYKDRQLDRAGAALSIADKRIRLENLRDDLELTTGQKRANIELTKAQTEGAVISANQNKELFQYKKIKAQAEAEDAETIAEMRRADIQSQIDERNYKAADEASISLLGPDATPEQKAALFRSLPESSQSTIMKRSATLTTKLYEEAQMANRVAQQADIALSLYQQGVQTGKARPFFDMLGGITSDLPGLSFLTSDWYKDEKLPKQQQMDLAMKEILAMQIKTSPKISDKDLAVMQAAEGNMGNTQKANAMRMDYHVANSELIQEKQRMYDEALASGLPYEIAESRFEDKYGRNFRVMRVMPGGEWQTFKQFKDDWIDIEQEENANFDPNLINEREIADAWMKGYHGRR